MDEMRLSTANATILTISILTFITGETLNVGILMASLENLKRGRNSVELIYFSMGLANICMQAALTVLNLMYIIWPHLFNKKEVYVGLLTLVSGLMCYSFWLTAWLCAHYCVIIANFDHQVFVWLKGLLRYLLKHIVLLSVVVLLFVSVFMSVWYLFSGWRVQCPGNCTVEFPSTARQVLSPAHSMIGFFVGSMLPFGLAFLSTGITASSLIRHMWKMKQKLSGFYPPNLQAVINATKTMILFLTLSVCFYIAELSLNLFPAHNASDIVLVTSWLVIILFPTAEAAIIIQASPKMKRAFLSRFCAWKPKKMINTT